jgi:hypothetical protein
MAIVRRTPYVTLGWQSWSLVAIVLVIVLIATVYLILG